MQKPIPLFGTEDRLPLKLGKLSYVDIEIYDKKQLGVKIRYESGITKADLYLYDLGYDTIPEDIRSGLVTELFQKSCRDVLILADRGFYLDFEIKATKYFHLPYDAPDPMYLWAVFYYRQAQSVATVYEGFRYSHLFLRTDFGFINKVRYTYPERIAEEAEGGMISFLLEWHEAISKV